MSAEAAVIRQHLIDPEICIRCNTCEATCPVGAITHDARNYVVDAGKCKQCLACLPPCPTGAIDNWRSVPQAAAYSLEAQFGWDELPAGPVDAPAPGGVMPAVVDMAPTPAPWSAARAQTHLYGPRAPQPYITATVAGNVRVTAIGSDYDTHHLVLDFGSVPFPLLEGQSIGILPPGVDASGRAHHARQYSIASPRNGERPGYNNAALAVKRVLQDHQGQPVRGVASNYLCDLLVGDAVEVIGPFGTSFLMPNHPGSHIVMICTGTGSAPMRAMTEWRRRLRASGTFESGRLMLFFGARSPQELPYFGPLQRLPSDFIDINFAYSRMPGQPKRHVQDLLRERAADIGALLADPDAYFFVCGLKSMEAGVLQALRDAAQQAGLASDALALALQSRLYMETY